MRFTLAVLNRLTLAFAAIVAAACSGGGEALPVPDAPPPVTIDCGQTPDELFCTGLYEDWNARTLAAGVEPFKPGFQLWSDGAEKSRFIALPAGTQIDVSNPNEWLFPVGTKLWKEFRVPVGGTLKRIETRLLWKTTADTWVKTAYVWSADERHAVETPAGVDDVAGTNHYTVPAQSLCGQCHSGRQDSVLGFEAVLLAAPEATGLTYAELLRRGLLTASNDNATRAASTLQIPGTAVERTALGTLHANCGVSCHSPNLFNKFTARIEIGASGTPASVQATSAFTNLVNQRSQFRPTDAPATDLMYRIRPLDLDRSMVPYRMSVRGVGQMPPIVTHIVDDAGLGAVRDWVEAMTEANGYPPPAPATGPDAGPMPDAGPTPDAPITTHPDAPVGPFPDAPTSCSLPKLKLTLAASGFSQPVYVTSPPGDSRLFVVEKGGTIRIVKNGVTNAAPFLSITGEVNIPTPQSEGGLLGLAFHPGYAGNGRFFIHYSTSGSRVVLREFHRTDGKPDLADQAFVGELSSSHNDGFNHLGGMVAFGSDGYIYDSLGDRAFPPPDSPARDLSDRSGKILRIDVDTGNGPPGNMTGTGVDPLIWDYGLRNPWRFSFDRVTGTLYIGDVGEASYEEIDVEPAGAGQNDYGWDVMEGKHCLEPGCTPPPGSRLPVVEHSHASGEATTIIGGFVYRGGAIACLRGRYIYGDYGTSRIFSFVYSGGAAADKIELTADLDPSGSLLGGLVSFGEDADGELYLVNIGSGNIYRIDTE
jgi:glucose/arabinose dehydrogenase